jgi:hypothetical protein
MKKRSVTMLDYNTHQILHKQQQRELIAQRERQRLIRLAHPAARRRARLPIGLLVMRLLRTILFW